MFKIVILQRYYNLSDDSTEYATLDRLSFMRFLGLTLSHSVPDAKTIWNFKNELAKGDMVNKLFKKLDNRLDKEGVIIHEARWPMPPLLRHPASGTAGKRMSRSKLVKCQRIGKKT
ncbi:MAG: transposase [bacterium]